LRTQCNKCIIYCLYLVCFRFLFSSLVIASCVSFFFFLFLREFHKNQRIKGRMRILNLIQLLMEIGDDGRSGCCQHTDMRTSLGQLPRFRHLPNTPGFGKHICLVSFTNRWMAVINYCSKTKICQIGQWRKKLFLLSILQNNSCN
jgi:hypothetical protein